MPTSRSLASTPTMTCTTCSRTCRPEVGHGDHESSTLRIPLRHDRAARCVRCARPGAESPGARSAMMLKPPADSWPTYHGDYTGRRHSRADANHARQRAPAHCCLDVPDRPRRRSKRRRFSSTASSTSTMPDNMWAIDARTGRQIWRYTYPPNQAFHIGHRGAAIYKDIGVS